MYPGSTICKHCYRPKLDALHLDNLDANDLKKQTEFATANLASDILVDGAAVAWNDTKSMPVEVGQDYTIDENGQYCFSSKTLSPDHGTISETSKAVNCYGHRCPACQKTFSHTYKCWPGTTEILHCPDCFSQASADIHRPIDISAMQLHRKHTAREIIEIQLTHRQFCVLEMSKTPEYETWFANHLDNIEKQIESLNAKKYAAKSALVERRTEESAKLTSEEIESFKRQAKRNKNPLEKEAKATKKAEKAAWDGLLKMLLATGKSQNDATASLTQMFKSQGKEIPE
jgi:hypothetical protein